ncbi:MAG: hypothetical protein AAB512_02550 [Patescibacteria group bacterium]
MPHVEIERRIGPDVDATISIIVRLDAESSEPSSAIAIYTQGKKEHTTTVSLGTEHDLKVGDRIKLTPIWRHLTSQGISTEFNLVKDHPKHINPQLTDLLT